MNKNCKICTSEFQVSNEEVKFLEKISPEIGGTKFQIPLPENCPDCRLALRNVQRNEQNLYNNKSAVTGKPLVSIYSPDTEWGRKYKIYTHEEWWSDDWDGLDYGQDFDFNRSFFEQFEELNLKIPKNALIQVGNENSPYTTGTGYCKNCYLINCSENCEDCYYGKLLQGCTDVMDSNYGYDSVLLYECFNVTNCYNCKYVSYSQNSSDCWFSDNLRGCKNCFLCTNLVNKEYHYMNEKLSKEEYEAKVKEHLSSAESVRETIDKLELLRKYRIYKYSNIVNCEDSSGDFLSNCKNCTDCYDVNDSEDCKYVTVGVKIKDVMDCSNMYLKPELNYQVLGTIETYDVIFSLFIFHSQSIMYSQFCYNSKNLFGCNGLRNKKYCILNKQYTQEEYEKMVPRIIEHMKKTATEVSAYAGCSTGEWGQYFPANTSTFGYNETVAQDYLPLTKEQALEQGYKWKDPDRKDYKSQTYSVPGEIKDVSEDILKEIIACEECSKNYKIIPQELRRLKKIGLPIPKKCPNCRHIDRMKLRNPRKLWDRACSSCRKGIKTTFAEDRPEIVSCESCYLKEVN